MSDVRERLRRQARARPLRVLFPEGEDARVVRAAAELVREGLARPLILTAENAATPIGVQAIDGADPDVLEPAADAYAKRRAPRGMTLDLARAELRQDRLLLAAALLDCGRVDAVVAGSVATTAEVLRAALRGVGTRGPGGVVSSFFLMELTCGRVLSYADCGVVPDPDARQLAAIAIATADSHRVLTGAEPLTAFLSFSTKGSAVHQRVAKVIEAMEVARAARPDLAFDGELQFDAAFVPEIADRKAPGSPVAGRANVMIFPDLDAANIAYKITERIGGARASGPLIQGLARPYMDLSRGCSSEDVVSVALIASAFARAGDEDRPG